ncbi:copper resistance protein CopC [Aeromicrobium sp. CF3.5]|uniref:copper resistance protein CopC n=1 Tax=Aeromicrobium sp. CF3.5 TaxID=3373078 RepID=UPI003EE4833A
MTPRPLPDRFRQVTAACVAAVALVCIDTAILAPGAYGHTSIDLISPEPDERLAVLPDSINLEFSDPVEGRNVRATLTLSNTTEVKLPEPVGVDGDVSIDLPEPSTTADAEGSYLLTVGVVGADGHAVQSQFAFVVGDGPLIDATGQISGGANTPAGLATALLISSLILRSAFVVLMGGLVVAMSWRAALNHRAIRGTVLGAGVLTFIASIAEAGLQNAEAAYASGVATTLTFDPLATPFTRLMCLGGVIALVWALAIVGMKPRDDGQPAVGWVNTALIAGAICTVAAAGTSHAASQGAFFALAVVHTATVSAWLGGVLFLYLGVRLVGPAPAPTLASFRTLALALAAVGIISGVTLALALTGGLRGADGPYLVWLGAKATAVVALLAAAARSAYLTNAPRRGQTTARQPKALLIELGAGALAMVVAATLAAVPPTS